MSSREDFDKARAQTKAVYERRARQFDKDRSRSGRETRLLERFTKHIPQGGHILDLGCGTGEPIAAWLIQQGYRITGLDYSEPMLELARGRFPEHTWLHQDMRALNLDGPFDGILSWHGSFHLTQDEQRALLPGLCALLAAGGTLMLTIGPAAGEVTGTVGGETVYHASLDPEEYRTLLMAEGLADVVLANEIETGAASVVLGRKT